MTTWSARVGQTSDNAWTANNALAVTLPTGTLDVTGHGYTNQGSTGVRFTNVTVPNGATINSATVTLTAYSSYSTGSVLEARPACHAADNAGTFTTSGADLSTSTRPRTSPASDVSLASFTANNTYDIDVTAPVQAIINRGGWSSGNAIVVILDSGDSAGEEWQEAYSYAQDSAKAALLTIDYTAAGGTDNLTATGITASATVGTPTVTSVPPVALTATGITASATLGTPTAAQIVTHALTATGITASATVGKPTLAISVVAPEFVNATTVSDSATASTTTQLSLPSGAAVGDLLLAVITWEEDGMTITPPSGWSELFWQPLSPRNISQGVYTRVMQEGDTGPWTWTTNTSEERVGSMQAYRYTETPTNYAVSTDNVSSVSATSPSVTTVAANSLVIAAASTPYGTTWTPPTNYTERVDILSAAGANGVSQIVSGRVYASAGATGTATSTSANADYAVAAHVELVFVSPVVPDALTATGITSSGTVGTPTIGQTHAIGADGITASATLGAATIAQTQELSADGITASATVGTPVLSESALPDELTATGITASATVGTPTIAQVQALAADGITASATVGAPTAGQVHALGATGVTSTATVGTPGEVVGSATDWNVQVGDGYTDVSPKQLVRTSANYLYTVAPNCDSYPDFSATGLAQTIRVHKSNSTGLPSGFTRKDSSNEPAAVVGCSAAIDGNDDIRIVWQARSSSSLTRYLRYAVFDTGTDTWGSVTTIASDSDFDDIGQGHQNIALALDSSGVCHIVYLSTAGSGTSTDIRVYYRNNSGGSWGSATQVDSGVSYTGNQKAWNPAIAFDPDGRILVVWERGEFNGNGSGDLYSRVYDSGWGSTVQVDGGSESLEVGIDQSPSLLCTPDGTYHVAYILNNATNSLKYIRYAYSTNQGATWAANNPTNQATHNPSLGYALGKVRIYGHGTPDGSNHGENLYYFEGSGGSAAWGSWTQFVTGTNYDSSINVRWSQYFHNYPATTDIAYWNDAYPNVLYVGTDVAITHDLTADGLTVSATVGTAAIAQVHAVAADGLTASATLGTGTIAQVHALTATGATVAATLGTPSMSGEVALGATGILAAATVGTPSVAQAHSVVATGLLSSASVGTPAVGQTHVLGATGVSASATVGAPAVGQAHALGADGVDSTPTLGIPTLGETQNTDNLEATGLVSGPTVGAPTVSQEHSLGGAGVLVSPAVGAPAVGQVHGLDADGVDVSATLGSPALVQVVALGATGVTVSATVGAPVVGQAHALGATGVEADATLGAPDIGQVHGLTALAIVVSAVVGASALGIYDTSVPVAAQRLISVAAELRYIRVIAENRVVAVDEEERFIRV